MLTPGRCSLVLIDAWRATKLTGYHHQGALQQAALLQVDEQGRQRTIENGQAPAHAVGAVAESISHPHFAAVHVPAGAGRSATCLPRRRAGPAIDGDEADSRLDEASRQEQVLPQGIPAVAVTEAGVFALHVESPAWSRGGGQFVGAAVQFQPSLLACGR